MSPTRVVPPIWHSSFYWRIALSFVALVVLLLAGQSLMVSALMERRGGPFSADNPNAAAAALAARLSDVIEADASTNLDAALKSVHPDGPAAYVVLRDGRVAASSATPLSDAVRHQAEAALAGSEPHVPEGTTTGPVVTAPIQVEGRLVGLVVLPPPPMRGVIGRAADLLSLPGTLVLLLTGALAAVVIFVPARRRLAALEETAERFGAGDMTARADERGRDEIAGLGRAFNQMAADLTTRSTALETSNRLRRQMLADVSHELRTPLTAMRGYLETLAMTEGGDPATRARHLETLQREAGRLSRMVEDLLDLAKHEHGASSFTPRVIAIERVFDHVRRRYEQPADAAGIHIEIHVDPAVDQIVADPDRLEQVVSNLAANALRHTPRGGTVRLAAEAVPEGCRVSVVDSGAGVPPEHVPHVFDRFYKVDSSRAGAGAGSGLGLSIVKAIVERHGGHVAVESRPGRTAFIVTLPQPADGPQSSTSAHL